MKYQLSLSIVSLLCALSNTSQVVAAEKLFHGPYLGVEAGLDSSKHAGARDESLYLGGFAGYRHQFESGLVIGTEFAFGKNDYAAPAFGALEDVNIKHQWALSANIGYAFGEAGSNLLFAKLGYAKVNFDALQRDSLSDALPVTINEGQLQIGGGYERYLSKRISLRLGIDYLGGSRSNLLPSIEEKLAKQVQGKVGVILNF
ncbi:MAG: porin family protein [Kordiimonadaceae bacterium]|nr:porin family protein [Kordiimonadaceae bacterium]